MFFHLDHSVWKVPAEGLESNVAATSNFHTWNLQRFPIERKDYKENFTTFEVAHVQAREWSSRFENPCCLQLPPFAQSPPSILEWECHQAQASLSPDAAMCQEGPLARGLQKFGRSPAPRDFTPHVFFNLFSIWGCTTWMGRWVQETGKCQLDYFLWFLLQFDTKTHWG